jgi:hypothetical protein
MEPHGLADEQVVPLPVGVTYSATGLVELTVTSWGLPVAEVKSTPLATPEVRVQVPAPTKLTLSPEVVQVDGVEELTEVVPSPFVETVAVKPPPTVPEGGRFVIEGVVGVAWPTEKDCSEPEAPV